MNPPLVEFFRHNRWANLRLLDACTRLSAEQLDASTPGTYGSVRATLVHLCAGEESYVARLAEHWPEQPLRERDGFPGMAELRQRAQQSGDSLIAIAAQVQPTQLVRVVWQGETHLLPATLILIQAINHATEHRSQIATILSQHGVEPPESDGWSFEQEIAVP